MKIHTNINDIKELSIFKQLDHPVALTAPLIVDDQVLIGMYCHLSGCACIHIDINEFGVPLFSVMAQAAWSSS